MPTVSEIMDQLESKGSEQTRKIYRNHGAANNFFGVKVADLKIIAKKIKGQQQLAIDLYDTENVDAMYLAGLVADGAVMTKTQLNSWAKKARWYMISEYTVPFVATEHKACIELAKKWMKSKTAHVAAAGWATYSGALAVLPDEQLDLTELKQLLKSIQSDIHTAANRVRYTMNGFVIATGGYVQPLLSQAKQTAKKIGKVSVEMGNTSCKVPLATDYIEKMESKDRIGKKRKTIKC